LRNSIVPLPLLSFHRRQQIRVCLEICPSYHRSTDNCLKHRPRRLYRPTLPLRQSFLSYPTLVDRELSVDHIAMLSKLSLSALALAVFPVAIRAHIALWDEAMFGWEDDPNQSNVVTPLANMAFNDWWLHGPDARNKPPKDGKFMELPSGGVYHGYTSCNKQQSK
jgi:hypothetical protein